MRQTTRRIFLKTGLTGATGATLATSTGCTSHVHLQASIQTESRNRLPRWRGFNLLPFIDHKRVSDPEATVDQAIEDLKLVRDLGFDYIRLPFTYWLFVDGSWKQTGKMDPAEVRNINEANLEQLDRMVEACGQYGLHLTLNMHRAPGYCINQWNLEPYNLFKDQAAVEDFVFHWNLLARRYEGISAGRLSFNLVNEAPIPGEKMDPSDYRRAMLAGRDAIRSVSPDRTIIIDGLRIGNDVVTNMLDEGVDQALHMYNPFQLTHYRASWIPGSEDWPVPEYPTRQPDGTLYGKRVLAISLAPWAEAVRRGIGVHCGEFGCFNHTPHKAVLAWMEDALDLLKQAHIGWALWNFRGGFGILDSNRQDVAYENWNGHKLDRKLLELLQQG